jgi:hypothetical protein
MCWSADVSLSTFVLGLAAVCVGLVSGEIDVRYAVFFMSFVSIQLVEYFLWTHLGDATINRACSYAGLLLVLLQPLALGAVPASPIEGWRTVYFTLYASFLVVFAATWLSWPRRAMSTSVASNGHLLWHWMSWPVYLVAAWVAFFVIGAFAAFDWVGWAFVLATIGVSVFAYYTSGTAGSMWCWMANAASIFILVQSFAKMMKTCRHFV